jgi:hypothetical protein
MLTLKQRQERAARRVARIAARHMAIRSAACTNHERSEVMKKDQVKIGGTYVAKVSDRLTTVRITGESRYGGWDAVNTKTGKAIRIKSAQRLRGPAALTRAEVQAAKTAVAAHVGAGAKPAAGSAKDAKVASALAEEKLSPGAKADLAKVREAAAKPDPALDKALADAGKAKAEKKARAKGPKKASLLDLAAEVLAKAGKPMGCKEIVEQVLKSGRWTTKGKTPPATLYSAIIREIATKGKASRFRKTDRGQFAATGTKVA